MGIGKRIKEARNTLNLTQEELAKLLGVTKGAVANYEKETSHPKESVMYKMIEVLKVDANFLFQDMVNISEKNTDVTLAEYEFIKKYRFISEHSPAGAETVDYILNREYNVANQLKEDRLATAQQERSTSSTVTYEDTSARNAERISKMLDDEEKEDASALSNF